VAGPLAEPAADRKPPRLAAGERATLMALLQYQRESLVRKVAGVSEDGARRAIVSSGTSLLWLMKHMARAESVWVLRRFAGQDVVLPAEAVEDRDLLANAVKAYRSTWSGVDSIILDAPSLDEMCVRPDEGAPVNLRWVLTHLLEETARHAGHADILREVIDGTVGR
jgi:hypothetical protein